MNDSKKIILVDGSSYLHRAFHAMPSLNTSDGRPTGAVYGIVNMLRRLLKEHEPAHLAVIFDAPGGTFRDKIYAKYKANRPPMPTELRSQIREVHSVLQAMGLTVLNVPGVEADDVIGTIALQASARGLPVLISSSDKDLMQLVNDDIIMIDDMSNALYDRHGVIKKFGVRPEQIVDYLALVGDTSDNVPGVPMVGAKTAAKWLGEYDTLAHMIEKAAELTGKVGISFRAHIHQLSTAQQLVSLKTNVALDDTLAGDLLAALSVRTPHHDALRDCYQRLEFKTWHAELSAAHNVQKDVQHSTAHASQVSPGTYQTICDEKELQRWIKRLQQSPVFALHCCTTAEGTTADNAHEAELVGIAVSDKKQSGAYLPFMHEYKNAPAQLQRAPALALLKSLLEDDTQAKVGHNIKNDVMLLARYDIAMRGISFDTMLESYVLDSTGSRHAPEELWFKYLGYQRVASCSDSCVQKNDADDVANDNANNKTKNKNKKTRTRKVPLAFHQLPLEQATVQAGTVADLCLQLHEALWTRLAEEKVLQRVFTDIEMPLVPVLARMEANCVGLDGAMLKGHGADLAVRIVELEKRAFDAAGTTFNIASPKQIQEVLYGRLQLPVLRKTPGGQPSTAEPVLEELAARFDLPRLILEHRSLSKLKSTYIDTLPQRINPHSGRIHTTYHQAVTATGRLSSSDPNLQNIPIRTQEGRRIREAFVADKKHVLLSADYSQIELRIMAHLSEDQTLLRAFRDGEDIHICTAAEVFAVALSQVTDDQRRHAKAVNFGLIYGMSAFGLAQQLHIDRDEAKTYIDKYFARYPGVKAYMDDVRAMARERGYVETVFGRRLYLPEIKSTNHNRRQYAERTAINAPMQGTAADLIKMAMIKIDRWITDEVPTVRMIMQVHDELVFEVPETDATDAKNAIVSLMSSVGDALSVPLEVDASHGANWAMAHS